MLMEVEIKKSKKWGSGFPTCPECGKLLGDYRLKFCKSHSKIGDRNPKWAGDSVQYVQLHAWIKSRLPMPELCENCYSVSPYDLANKSGEYKRDISDWLWLCRRCHMKSDGRLEKFISHTNAGKFGKENGNYRHGKRVKSKLDNEVFGK